MFAKLVTVSVVLMTVVTAKHLEVEDDADLEPEWPAVESDSVPSASSTSGLSMRLLLRGGPVRGAVLPERTRRSPSPVYTGYFPSRSHGSTSRSKSGTGEGKGRIMHGSIADDDDLEGVIPSDDLLLTSAQSLHGQKVPGARRASHRPGYSGTVTEGKSRYVSRYNQGVPVYGAGEPYYFSYTHNFPIGVEDFENLVNSHNLPKKYKFTGSLDVTGLLE